MIRRYRSVTVCLVLLCVLLLTAVIVLCVLINTNNQQFNIKTKIITEERDQLLTNNTILTEERDKLRAKSNNFTNLSEQFIKLSTDGWIYYQSSFYYNSSEEKNWTESRSYCKEKEADLIIINNKEEHDFVHKVSGTESTWIGLTDIDVEGRWKWVDNSTLNYSFWVSGEPNDKTGTENCVESYPSGWNDLSCNKPRNWICERTFYLN
nr:CD209 antigen-like protein C [Misgurnus anguillicaudatus]